MNARAPQLLTVALAALGVFGSSTAVGQRASPLTLAGSKVVTIGAAEGPPETLFAGVMGAVLLRDGHVAIADGGNYVIRIFDAAGSYVRTIGRQGRGPEEFEGLWWIGLCPDGTVLAIDAVLARASRISPRDGRLLRTVSLPSWIRFNDVLSCERGGRLPVLLKQPVQHGETGKVTRFPAALVQFSPGAAAVDTLLQLSGSEFYFASKVAGFSPLPLGARAFATAGGGRVFVAQNDEALIHVFNPPNERHHTFTHGLPQPEMTAASWMAAKAEMIASFPLERTRKLASEVLAEATPPSKHPAFTDMKADRAGRLWLRLPSTASVATWQVYGAAGNRVTSVSLPSEVQPLDIGESFIIGLQRDSLDVQRIVVYTFQRPFLTPGAVRSGHSPS